MNLTSDDYYIAAIGDALVENLSIVAADAANQVANNGEEFFWAIQAAIQLKEISDGEIGF